VLHAGTTGADGIEAFRPDKSNPYTANLLTFVRVGDHMELAQLDKLSQPTKVATWARQTIIDRYAITEPWWSTRDATPPILPKPTLAPPTPTFTGGVFFWLASEIGRPVSDINARAMLSGRLGGGAQ